MLQLELNATGIKLEAHLHRNTAQGLDKIGLKLKEIGVGWAIAVLGHGRATKD
jgi:hypothetical protein